MDNNLKLIKNVLALRKPQVESLVLFDAICSKLSLTKGANLEEEIKKIKEVSQTFENFDDRDFPSICFSLATGVGKTRLMGAFIAYLYYEKGIKNFFVMAPNLTIYNKLIKDFGDSRIDNEKYVFKGLAAFATAPRIINGENYDEFRQTTTYNDDIVINVFNISKLNSDTKSVDGKPARIKRLNEVLGESYFNYLVNLPDLVLLMDESHHYRADRGMTVINELKPILGIEVTATPQTQKGNKKIPFKNVVYEYSLAHALEDGDYIKIPAVATRKDFLKEQYSVEETDKIKLIDGIIIHRETKLALEKYAKENNKKIVKPFVLVVAKDTNHSKKIYNYITSDEFPFKEYKDKVIEVNSCQTGAEKDENIDKLLSVEKPENKIEIVIHVNMLKEGWDVSNLYTIIPLRTSASETLTEQTIGRGLRLPYGARTNEEKVDTLTIVSHDKYKEIIDLANSPNSLVRRIYYINLDSEEAQKGKNIIELPSKINQEIENTLFIQNISNKLSDGSPEDTKELAQHIANVSYMSVMNLRKKVKSFEEIKNTKYTQIALNEISEIIKNEYPTLNIKNNILKNCINETIEEVVQMVKDIVIPIPQVIITPKLEIIEGFHEFELDTTNINYIPSDDNIIIKDLSKDGHTSYIRTSIIMENKDKSLERDIINEIIISKSEVDYEKNADLLYSLVGQVREHLRSYLSETDVIKVLTQRKKDIANEIYSQMKEHFYKKETRFESSEMLPFSEIEVGYGEKFCMDDVCDFRVTIQASKIIDKVFTGFKRSCHNLYKFKSNTEKTFAIILEDDGKVQKWMCPSRNQFKLYWNGVNRYQPDFIVETEDCIYIIEIKDRRMMETDEITSKAKVAIEYCRMATKFNEKYGGKPWKYVLVPDDSVRDGMSFNWLAKNYKRG